MAVLGAGIAAAGVPGCPDSPDCFDSTAGRWLKGNTHAHSVTWLRNVIPHGDSGAAHVARWYRDNGYDFAVISDHNSYTDPAEPRLAQLQNERFILIPGVEITSDYRVYGAEQAGERAVHSTALNVRHAPDWRFADVPSGEILSTHIERTRAAGGVTIVNHPNYHMEIGADDLLAVEDLRLLEIHNAYPGAKSHAGRGRPSVESLWDTLLTRGRRVYGIASDDAHYFKLMHWTTLSRKNFALPGSAWVMVNAADLDADTIVDALVAGRFYSTTGVVLRTLRYDRDRYELEVDFAATRAEVGKPLVAEGAPPSDNGAPGLTIEFVGRGGRVLHTVRGRKARLEIRPEMGYVRARIGYVAWTRTRIDDAPVLRRFSAWTQPVFTADAPRELFSDRGPAR